MKDMVCQTKARDIIGVEHPITKTVTMVAADMLTRTWQEI